MKHIFYSSLLILAANLSVYATDGKITGKIIAESENNELSYVAVSIGPNSGTYTNNKGQFVLENLDYGNYQLSISYIGYERVIIENIKISEEDKTANLGVIKLKESAIRIPEITITAINTNYNEKYKSSNSVINNEYLNKVQPIGTEEALKTQLGVNVSGDMGISNRLNIGVRGSYPRRSGKILLLEDGTPIAPAPYLAPEAYYNPPADRLDGIEIIKGADILTYGPNTMYGVVNYITKRPPLKPSLGINITGGENGYQSQFITYGGTWNNIGAELQVLNKQFNGFQQNTGSDIFNTTAKVFADFGKRSSAYMKINYHQENSKATYSGLTPLTFNKDPRQNPFDADDLATKRYAADLVYNYKITQKLTSSSKLYGSQFTRDWWRQNTSLQKASGVQSYLGDNIYNSRYSYLANGNYSDYDYVRVGSLVNGRESTTARNRLFRVAGVQETLKLNTKINNLKNITELSVKLHTEQFYNQEQKNDSSRFARSGRITKDEKYLLNSVSGYLKNELIAGNFTLIPAVRFEMIDMHKFDLMSISSNPDNDGSKYFGSVKNTFNQIIPGISANYKIIDSVNSSLSVYGGIYRGYTPPTSEVGFFAIDEENNVNTKPVTDETLNMLPEISNNFEAGMRGYLLNNAINGQITYFNNSISNYYSAGRNEAFQTLGSVNISGIESGVSFSLKELINSEKHNVKIGVSYTYLISKITAGKLVDNDLLSAKHTPESKAEVINKINEQPGGYNVYFAGDSLITRELTTDDFSKIKKVEMIFGNDAISNNRVPYVPEGIMNINFSYSFKEFSIGGNLNMVSAQFTDYMNLTSETAEGAMGKLPAYKTIDMNMSYNFSSGKHKILNGLSVFIAAKNITNEIYKASRLHRVSSGIMPGGFRQVNAGIRVNL
jgi:Fe(3+) dicitrate transport protein